MCARSSRAQDTRAEAPRQDHAWHTSCQQCGWCCWSGGAQGAAQEGLGVGWLSGGGFSRALHGKRPGHAAGSRAAPAGGLGRGIRRRGEQAPPCPGRSWEGARKVLGGARERARAASVSTQPAHPASREAGELGERRLPAAALAASAPLIISGKPLAPLLPPSRASPALGCTPRLLAASSPGLSHCSRYAGLSGPRSISSPALTSHL